jgi:hypothetical protein
VTWVELTLQEQPELRGPDIKLLGNAFHIVAVAGQLRLKVVDLARKDSIVCGASEWMARYHNPMPAILESMDYDG